LGLNPDKVGTGLPLCQDILAKIGSMNRSKTFGFGQQPVWFWDHSSFASEPAGASSNGLTMSLFHMPTVKEFAPERTLPLANSHLVTFAFHKNYSWIDFSMPHAQRCVFRNYYCQQTTILIFPYTVRPSWLNKRLGFFLLAFREFRGLKRTCFGIATCLVLSLVLLPNRGTPDWARSF
jgi:hypothetical protein